jgi:hypothetical protein
MRHPTRTPAAARRGATLVEAALIFPVFLLLILGMIDLGVYFSRSNMLSMVARQGARRAIVHGAMAPPALGTWGPATYGPLPLSDSGAIAQEIQPFLAGIDPSEVTITVEWLDNSNVAGSRVRVTLTHDYSSTTTLGLGTLALRASSTMLITH